MLPQVRMRLGQKNKRIYFVCRSTFTNFAPYMLNFISFGSGSSGNCYYLGNDQHAILIDAGIPVRTIQKILRENGLAFGKVMALLVTHDHTDHIRSAGSLGELYHIPVYSTKEVQWSAIMECLRNSLLPLVV